MKIINIFFQNFQISPINLPKKKFSIILSMLLSLLYKGGILFIGDVI